MQLTVKQRVANGVKELDEKNPGWYMKINIANFDIKDSCRCVLGYVYGYYVDGMRKLVLVDTAEHLRLGSSSSQWARDHGFLAYDQYKVNSVDIYERLYHSIPNDAMKLDEEWIKVIQQLQEDHVANTTTPHISGNKQATLNPRAMRLSEQNGSCIAESLSDQRLLPQGSALGREDTYERLCRT